MKKTLFFIAVTAVLVWGFIVFRNSFPREENTFRKRAVQDPSEKDIKVVAEGLIIPWEIAFLPNGDPEGEAKLPYGAGMLITERPGTLLKIGQDRRKIPIQGVEHIGEGGLLGMALHPRFAENRWIYLYFTAQTGNGLTNRVERYRLEEERILDKKVVIAGIPGASYHDGGRIAFGPDGYLYIATGDAGITRLAQDINSLAGKILRLREDGSIPEDNPFGNAVWSYGHRNSQGLAWDDQGRMWATEHGRSGILSGFDELNLIERGANYGWPQTQGDEAREGTKRPIIHSGSNETWAPAAALFYKGGIFFTGLRGESLYEARITSEGKVDSIQAHFRGEFGRLRALVLGPDGYFYISTSNTDGRGELKSGDDKIIKLHPDIIEVEPQ